MFVRVLYMVLLLGHVFAQVLVVLTPLGPSGERVPTACTAD